MAPKKPGAEKHDWRTNIENAQLDEATWKVKVIMMEVAGSEQDTTYLTNFESFAAEEKRFVVKIICKTETIFMVNQLGALGGEKKMKDDNLQVFEEGLTYLRDKKEIPPEILALIIKHLIMKMKDEYLFIRRQRLEVRQGMKRELATMFDKAEVRGTVNVKPPEAEPQAPPPKGKKGKVAQEQSDVLPEPDEGKKYNTQLRVRGEEWRDKVYVDDFPTDGPNLYVAVTGFAEPYLPGCLVKIGIPLTAIVQIRIDPSSMRLPSALLRASKRGQSHTDLAEKSLKFWEVLQTLRIEKNTAADFNNTALIVFRPPYWENDDLSGKPDKIYDELCFLMYDVQDLSRQHVHYLENMDIISVPKELKENRYYNYFCNLVDDLPFECLTLYSVLDGILQTICKSHEIDKNTSRSSLSTALTIIPPIKTLAAEQKKEKAKNLVNEVFNSFCKTDANRKSYRLTYGEEYETHKNPIIINYGDFAKYNTFHLGNINLDNIVWSSLLNMPVNKLWINQNRPHGELEAKINFHVNVLLSCFEREDVETAELNRLIHILACRKLFNNRSSLKKRHLLPTSLTDFKKVYLKRSILAEPLQKCPSIVHSGSFKSPSFPSMTRSENVSNVSCDEDAEIQHIKLLFECPDISELISAAEIANQKPIGNLIDDFEYFEDFSGISALQVMLDAFNQFNCIDYKYCEVTDCFLLMFFNSHDKEGISREEWRSHLPTPLCLQDFFDFVLDEHYDWIKKEEKIYDDTMIEKAQSEHQLLNEIVNKSCVDTTDVELDLLMEGSLKYKQIQAMEEETSTPEDSTIKSKSKKTTTISPSSASAVDSKSSRKMKSPANITPKLKQSFMFHSASQTSEKIPCKPFLGYDLGFRRVEVFGKDEVYFSKDGSRVKTMYSLIVPINIEYIIMNVVPGNSYNEFWVYKAVGDETSSDTSDDCESFRITSKDQVMINVKKQTYKVPIITESTENLKPKEIPKSPSGRLSPEQQIFETKQFHSFNVTWPNGLITESVHEDNSASISHIKQYFLNTVPDLDEDMRCISLNGEVVIFKKSGIIEVLKPEGSYIKITKCWKQGIVSEISKEESVVSSDKGKKGAKGKDKSKEKPSKTSSKTSKNVLNDEDKRNQEKPLEYELIIEEFETVATSGLRQRWINDVSFDIEKLLIRTATDYCQGEIFSRRMDGTHILLNKDGIQVVTFPNKTRIITKYVVQEEEFFLEWTDEERQLLDLLESNSLDTTPRDSVSQKSYVASTGSTTSKKVEEEEEEPKIKGRTDGYISVKLIYSIEHPNFTTVTMNTAEDKISVDSPNNTSVQVDVSNFYNITLDKSTSAQFNGENLHISYEACPECQAYTTCEINMKSNNEGSLTGVAEHNWLKMKDSFYKSIVVNNEGSISLYEEPCFEETINVDELGNAEDTADTELSVPKTESSVISHGKCRETYLAKTMRFFVLKR